MVRKIGISSSVLVAYLAHHHLVSRVLHIAHLLYSSAGMELDFSIYVL